jgi:hypothetical protein
MGKRAVGRLFVESTRMLYSGAVGIEPIGAEKAVAANLLAAGQARMPTADGTGGFGAEALLGAH